MTAEIVSYHPRLTIISMPHTCLRLQNYSTNTLCKAFDEATHAFLLCTVDWLRDKTGHAVIDSIAESLVRVSAKTLVSPHPRLGSSYLSSSFEPTPDACHLVRLTDTFISV